MTEKRRGMIFCARDAQASDRYRGSGQLGWLSGRGAARIRLHHFRDRQPRHDGRTAACALASAEGGRARGYGSRRSHLRSALVLCSGPRDSGSRGRDGKRGEGKTPIRVSFQWRAAQPGTRIAAEGWSGGGFRSSADDFRGWFASVARRRAVCAGGRCRRGATGAADRARLGGREFLGGGTEEGRLPHLGDFDLSALAGVAGDARRSGAHSGSQGKRCAPHEPADSPPDIGQLRPARAPAFFQRADHSRRRGHGGPTPGCAAPTATRTRCVYGTGASGDGAAAHEE